MDGPSGPLLEVVSPSDRAEEVMTKVGEYFAAGVRQVWIVFPTQEQIHVYESVSRSRILTRSDSLDGGEVIPGFRLPLAELFTHVE